MTRSLAQSLRTLTRDCIDQYRHGGLGAVVKRALYFLFDPRRPLIRKELSSWGNREQLRPDPGIHGTPGLVTVIIPVYDRVSELRESVDSVLSQTYRYFELLLITDGSPPETLHVVEQYAGHPQVRIFHFSDNSGTAVRGRNVGICEARGEFVAFQDSDDIAEPGRLAESVSALQETQADIVYGGWRARVEVPRQGVEAYDAEVFLPRPFSIKDLFRNNRICHGSVMMRKVVFGDIGMYKPHMRFREDHELWLRAAYYGYRFHTVSKVLTILRIHNSNNTLNFILDDTDWYRLMLSEYKVRGPLL
ncbi:glycosyltransferase [Geobacter sp. DSM 9736]|uniref:glycosyltransferase family 2 protein n=1 Tax=Geobacter sp. DSM 9736 TaxID=1277350 RepID=UPI000B50289B|nr:glycosyltransferase [Geobacter sp. DSM 9736]SNB46613.1 Glycosyl transferase family 2 [Geobacter sp. DSM 9736]